MSPLLTITIAGLVVLSLAALAVWLLIRSLKRSTDPAWLLFRWILTLGVLGFLVLVLGGWGPSFGSAFIMPIVCVVLGIILSLLWAPSLAEMFARPMTNAFDGGVDEAPPEPLYSIAEARRKKGQYHEAIWAIQDQLKLFPQDFKGQMLMAEIQAEDLKDADAAEATLQRFLQQHGHTPAERATALNRIADWRLKFRQDREGAAQALQTVIDTYPDSSFAYTASQRLAHLASPETLLESQQPRLIPVPVQPANEPFNPARIKPPPVADEDIPGLVRRLEAHPEDNEAREQLALAYARQHQRLDLALNELEQLIAQPNAPVRNIAHWLNLIADLQIEFARDEEAARQTLERIMEMFPGHPVAELARQRQNHLKFELRKATAPAPVKLGQYEQDLGLKLPPRYAGSGYKPPPV